MNIEGRLDHGKTDPVYRVYSGSRLVFSTHRSPLFTHQDDRERDPRIIYVERGSKGGDYGRGEGKRRMREGKSWSARWDEARGVSDESQGVEDGGGAAASELLAIYGSPFWPTPPHPTPPHHPFPFSPAGLSSLEAIFLFLARLYQITINIAVATCSSPSTPSHRLRRRQRLNVGRKINTRSEEGVPPSNGRMFDACRKWRNKRCTV